MFKTKTKPAEPTPKWSLLQVPDQYLTEEQITEQSAYQKFVANLPSSAKAVKPTGAEINLVLEIAALEAFFKLRSRTIPYQQFVDAIKKKNSEKVLEFIFHNAGLFEVVANDKDSSLIIKKSENFGSERDFYLEGICPSALIPKIQKKQSERQEERRRETKNGFVEDDQVKNGNETNGKTDDASNASNYSSARSGSHTSECLEDGDINKEIERIGAETKQIEENLITPTSNRNKVQDFEEEMEKVLAGIEKREEEVPVRILEKEDENEMEQFNQNLRKLHQQDEKDYKKMNEKANEEIAKQLKTFREKMVTMEKEAREAEELERKQTKERNDKEQAKFQKLMEEKKEKHRAAMEEMRKERERIEAEAEEACRQHLADFRARTEASWNCMLLQMKWEDDEQRWTDWINTLKSAVVKVKVQFMNCQDSLRSYACDKESESIEMIQMNLSLLRQKVLSCHELLHDAFFHLKKLSEKIPDRLFLRILMKSLQLIADKILVVLLKLDKVEINESTHDILQGMLGTIDASDILATWKLREISKTAKPEDYEDVKEPMKYEPEGPKIQEVLKPSEERENQENQECD